jgi:squalene-hopene/tetraprenyl-beta-curcumene cyclase
VGAVRDRLLQWMHADGFWEGRLSSSALSTATALSALALADDPGDMDRIGSGMAWLAGHQNADGGWGDTADGPSNLATTVLAIAAMNLVMARGAVPLRVSGALAKAQEYLAIRVGDSPRAIVEAVQGEYGADRTFAIPILMNCGLAGLAAWDDIPGLPFELAVFPHSWYKLLRLHVVSYALPALIAIGLLTERRHPPAGILRQLVRRFVRPRVLEKLRRIQPEHGGFLEAAPLTSFVAMAMTALYGRDQPVATECLRFLRRSQRSEGAWPIDTNLSVWLTTAAVAALAAAGELPRIDRSRTARWISAQQHKVRHPYTHAEPGGWAWTHLAGGVPDVDDTSGAILALKELGYDDGVATGVEWLLAMQNGDGGWPTFCRGWGKLPFDRSSPDLTAHALRAICCDSAGDRPLVTATATARRLRRTIRHGLNYLDRVQQADGSWIPLWFGNQGVPGQTNPVLGTSRVLRALEFLDRGGPAAARGVEYLLRVQNADGGWGGAEAAPSSLEEAAMAVAALAAWTKTPATHEALFRGVRYLMTGVAGLSDHPAPIGLYFAHLWYSEALYPLIWTLDALGRVVRGCERNAVHCGRPAVGSRVTGPQAFDAPCDRYDTRIGDLSPRSPS